MDEVEVVGPVAEYYGLVGEVVGGADTSGLFEMLEEGLGFAAGSGVALGHGAGALFFLEETFVVFGESLVC